jgi:hypothetical protein
LNESSEPAVRDERAILQEAQVRIALAALAITSVAIMVTASALNAIATSKSETDPRRNDLTRGSAANFHYGIAHVSMPKGQKTFPPELLPEP